MKRVTIFIFLMFFSLASLYAVYCPRCRYDNAEESRYCSQCGYPLTPPSQEFIYCPNCGHQNPYAAPYCSKCWTPFRQEPSHHVPSSQGQGYDFFPPKGGEHDHSEGAGHHHGERPAKGWRIVGSLVSTGKSKGEELAISGKIHRVKLKCTHGSSVVNTLVIREGGRKTPFPITTRFSPGQEVIKDLPREFSATGFRISHEGNGTIEVSVE